MTAEEKGEIIKESKNIYGLKELIPSILLVEDLSRTRN